MSTTEPQIVEDEISDHDRLETLINNTDAFFVIIIAIIIFFMQGGFAFLEAGSVRSKNAVNILIKNMLDAFIGGISYWAIGWGLSYGPGGNGFAGGSKFFGVGMEASSYPAWFFQFVFAATASTIVSGAIAERCQFIAYFVYSITITAWVYPIVSHWAWDADTKGWLNELGYKDFAGSGVVHLVGGSCAAVGCAIIGARQGRFTKEGVKNIPGHSVPMASLGGFILIFGFLAFNGGSQGSISQPGDSDIVALAIVNTILGACGGGLTTLFTNKYLLGERWSYLMTLNGALGGMVALCAGCNIIQPWLALLTGAFAGFAFLGTHILMLKIELDDPLDAVAVHGAGGLVGLYTVPFFEYENGILWKGDNIETWYKLGINIAGSVCIIIWCFFWSTLFFGLLRYFGHLRINADTEFQGVDMIKHGEPAYPAAAWVELQYETTLSSTTEAIINIPSVMSNKREIGAKDGKGYNNPFEMMPSAGKLFRGISGTLSNLPCTKPDVKANNPEGVCNAAFESA